MMQFMWKRLIADIFALRFLKFSNALKFALGRRYGKLVDYDGQYKALLGKTIYTYTKPYDYDKYVIILRDLSSLPSSFEALNK